MLTSLGSGGEGSVYLVRDLVLGTHWAMKVQKREACSEGKILSRLEHPGILRLVDRWESSGFEYLVMEYFRGRTLRELFERGEIPKEKLLPLAVRLAEILVYLHGLSPPVIHGDIKPENLLAGGDGQLYLIDFGCAKNGYQPETDCEKGTALFAAPEQRDGKISVQTDLYSFGQTLYLLSGNGKRAPRALRNILNNCRNPHRALRYQSTKTLLSALKRAEKKQQAAKRFRAYPLLLAAVFLFGAQWFGRTDAPPEKEIVLPKESEEPPAENGREELNRIRTELFFRLSGTSKQERNSGAEEGIVSLEAFLQSVPGVRERREAEELLAGLREFLRTNRKGG